MIDLIPSQSLEAETSVLGSIIIDNKSINEITELKPEHFYKTIHGKIYETMLEMYLNNEPIDLITLSEQLKVKKLINEIGGMYYLTTLAESVASSANILNHVEIIIEKFNLRQACDTAVQITRMIQEGRDSEKIYEFMGSQAVKSLPEHKQFSIKEVLHETCDLIDRRKAGEILGLKTGIDCLDGILEMEYGSLVVIGGYSSQGKTVLGSMITLHNIIDAKKGVMFFELEMSRRQLAGRLIALKSKVNKTDIWFGQIKDTDIEIVGRAIEELSTSLLWIDDTPGVSLQYIKGKVKNILQKHPIKLVVIDYLQLMNFPTIDREQAISQTTRGLKNLAKELEIVIVLISQFRRHEGTRFNKRPSMSDLKGSGGIEQDADIVLLTWMPNRWKKDLQETENKNQVTLIVEKQREGAIEDFDLTFNTIWIGFE